MKISNSVQYFSLGLMYKNFTQLTDEEIITIYEWRNNKIISKWMCNNQIIPLEEHFAFIHNLQNRDDATYWLVYKDQEPIAVFDITKINYSSCSGEVGFYLSPKYLDSGIGFELHNSYRMLCFSQLGFLSLQGSVLSGNTRAMQMSLFFNAKIIGKRSVDGKHYFLMNIFKQDYEKVKQQNLLHNFVLFIKQHPIDWNTLLS